MEVKIARIRKGLTQAELRKRIGSISPSTIVKVERGEYDNIKIGTAKRIAQALDCSVVELFFKEV